MSTLKDPAVEEPHHTVPQMESQTAEEVAVEVQNQVEGVGEQYRYQGRVEEVNLQRAVQR